MTEHILKCWPEYFDAIERGEKTFEVRRDDRAFQKGDVLRLLKYDDDHGYYRSDWHTTPTLSSAKHAEIRRTVTYILTGGQMGIEPGYVVLALEAQQA